MQRGPYCWHHVTCHAGHVQANESKSQRGFKRLARDADEAKALEQNI